MIAVMPQTARGNTSWPIVRRHFKAAAYCDRTGDDACWVSDRVVLSDGAEVAGDLESI